MMREFLFRGKATNRKEGEERRTTYKNGDWVYGLLTETEDYRGYSIMTNMNGICGIEVDKNTVGQFTGLWDKYNNKIFEGDILQESNGEDRGVVRYDDADGMYYLVVDNVLYDFSTCNSKWYEVIGNIHDDKELQERYEKD